MDDEAPLPPGWRYINFVDGPLDGRNPIHLTQNIILKVPNCPAGHYQFENGSYYWIDYESDSNAK
jgi:hypothetical protein